MSDPLHPLSEDLPVSCPFRVATLAARRPTRFAVEPDAAQRALVAALLGIDGVADMTFRGEIRPTGRRDFDLEGRLLATVVQPCSVTLAPVITRIDETVTRRYLADYRLPEAEEVEVPEDDSEPLPDVIDAGAVAVEALALALPLYPRAEGAALSSTGFGPPGVDPLTDEAVRPFAGLAALRRALDGGGDKG